MPKAFPKEFRKDVIRVNKDSDASMAQVAADTQDWLSWPHPTRPGRDGPSSDSGSTRRCSRRLPEGSKAAAAYAPRRTEVVQQRCKLCALAPGRLRDRTRVLALRSMTGTSSPDFPRLWARPPTTPIGRTTHFGYRSVDIPWK
ncbi:hypothetical protein Pve01_89010 [Planomonospora venezuelensis]|nr:hypothetical protein Pve01_89010 [Planomonospora venezuelensis]